MKKYRFFYHYNKPKKCLTVHHRGKCLLTDAIEVGVPTESKSNMDRQPHIVMQGWCEEVIHTKAFTVIK